MTDPHIDLDEVEIPSSNVNSGAEGIPAGGGNGFGFNPNFSEFATGFFSILERLRNQTGAGIGVNLDPLPIESRKHFRNSQREFLLGWRTIIDDALNRLDERDSRDTVRNSANPVASSGRSSSTKIEIEEIED